EDHALVGAKPPRGMQPVLRRKGALWPVGFARSPRQIKDAVRRCRVIAETARQLRAILRFEEIKEARLDGPSGERQQARVRLRSALRERRATADKCEGNGEGNPSHNNAPSRVKPAVPTRGQRAGCGRNFGRSPVFGVGGPRSRGRRRETERCCLTE